MTKKISLIPLTLFSTLLIMSCSQNVSVANESGVYTVKKENSNPAIAAKFDGKDITVDDLEKSSPGIFEARLKVFDEQKRAVEEYVRNAVLEGLAKKAGKSMDDFMKEQSEVAKKKISAKDVEAFLKKNNVADASKVPDHIKDQVRGLLHVQALVSNATKNNKVEVYLKRPSAPQITVKTEGEATWGDPSAKVKIVEFSDFQCPFCARGKDRLNELKKMYGKKIFVVFKQFPLPMHPDARPAAEASLCVLEQGSDKFWKIHDLMFENQDKLSASDLQGYAKKAGADVAKFDECVKAKKYASAVEDSLEEGRKLGVDSTPTFYVNSNPVHGAKDLSEFKELIDEELANN